MRIEANNISYKYENSQTVLDNISLTIKENEKVVILGANGCGKTTLLKIICGLYKPTLGNISLDGEVLKPSPSYDFLVGYVPQNPTEMFFEGTVSRETEFILIQQKIPKNIREQKVNKILEEFDLLKYKDRSPYTLSSGEQKKLAIVANIIAGQKFIFMDEPISDLDSNGIDMVEKFIHTNNRGIIATTHRLDFAKMFDRLVLMSKGAIIHDNITDIKSELGLLKEAGIVPLTRIHE